MTERSEKWLVTDSWEIISLCGPDFAKIKRSIFVKSLCRSCTVAILWRKWENHDLCSFSRSAHGPLIDIWSVTHNPLLRFDSVWNAFIRKTIYSLHFFCSTVHDLSRLLNHRTIIQFDTHRNQIVCWLRFAAYIWCSQRYLTVEVSLFKNRSTFRAFCTFILTVKDCSIVMPSLHFIFIHFNFNCI